MADLTLASDIKNYYTRLNAIRTNHGLGTVSAPTVTGTTEYSSSMMKTLKSNLENTANTSRWIPDVSSYDIGPIEVGDLVRKITDLNIQTILTNMEGICPYDAAYYPNHNGGYRNHDSSDKNNYCSTHRSIRSGDGSDSICSCMHLSNE